MKGTGESIATQVARARRADARLRDRGIAVVLGANLLWTALSRTVLAAVRPGLVVTVVILASCALVILWLYDVVRRAQRAEDVEGVETPKPGGTA